jgi:hypothetical protein
MSAHSQDPTTGLQELRQSHKLPITRVIRPISSVQFGSPPTPHFVNPSARYGAVTHARSLFLHESHHSKDTYIFVYYARSLLHHSLLPGEVPTTTWRLLLRSGHLKGAWHYSETCISVERRLMWHLPSRQMVGKFILALCGMTRKENRRTLPLTVCGQQLFRVIRFRITILKYSKHFCNEISENAAARCVSLNRIESWSQWLRRLRRRFGAASLLGLWVRIPPMEWTSAPCKSCVLSGIGLCVGLITLPEDSYRCWWVWGW